MKNGIIIINSYYDSSSQSYQTKRLVDEFNKVGVSIDVVKDYNSLSYIANNTAVNTANNYDFCIFLDKNPYRAKLLEKSGIKLFNNANSIFLCDDKMATYIALSNKNVNIPTTLSNTLSYLESNSISDRQISDIESVLSYPLIVKNCYGSLGKGVYLINNSTELKNISQKLITTPHLYQEFVSTSYGTDIRVIVIGKKYVGAILRKSSSDFRSNIDLDGVAYPFNLSKEIIDICVKCAEILDLDYCGVDILLGENNEPIVCEVNSNCYFTAFEKTTGINVAKIYAEHILSTL